MYLRIIEKSLSRSSLLHKSLFKIGFQTKSNILFSSYKNNKSQKYFYMFSTNKDNKPQPQPQIQSSTQKNKQPKQDTTKQSQSNLNKNPESNSKQIKQMTEQQIFNVALGLDKKYSFKNELVLSNERYKKQIKDLKQAILFQDLLKKQIDILIYDTHGKPFFHHMLRIFFMLVSVFGTVYLFRDAMRKQPKFKVYMDRTLQGHILIIVIKILCGGVFLLALRKHLKMTKRYVQKIMYNTQNENFTFTRRKFYGSKYEQKVSRFKILYTENPVLNKRGTNYLNIENQKQYKIGYSFAWKKQDLFSHLISQRIRT